MPGKYGTEVIISAGKNLVIGAIVMFEVCDMVCIVSTTYDWSDENIIINFIVGKRLNFRPLGSSL